MDAVDTTRRAILLFFLGLPMVMIGITIFLALSLMNPGMIILALGQVFIVPVAVLLIHFFTGFMSFAKIPSSDISMLVPSIESAFESTTTNVVPSYWAAHVVFFCSYVFFNALFNYKLDSVSTQRTYDWKVEHRRSRAIMIMAISLILLFGLLIVRMMATHAETLPGIIVALLAFMPLAYGWYEVAKKGGAHNSDILGIVNHMVAVPDDKAASMCVPTKVP